MKLFFPAYRLTATACLIMALSFLYSTTSSAQDKTSDTIIITDIAAWQHPVKNVLISNKVQLSKIVLTNNGKHPVFYVTFPYDPQTSASSEYFRQLYAEILAANGWWGYTLHAELDQIQIEISWDKGKNLISTNIVPLQKPDSR